MARPPVASQGFKVEPIDITENLLSGLHIINNGIVACDREKGALLVFSGNNTGRILVDNLDTPVDVERWNNQWVILQEEAGSLISVDPETNRRDVLADGFIQPSAFAIDDQGFAYIVEFITGYLYRVNLSNGNKKLIDIFFDRPSDILVARNFLIVADQVGVDGSGGAIYRITKQGKIADVIRNVIDPTGLALSNSGELFVTSFLLNTDNNERPFDRNNGGVLKFGANGQREIVVQDLIGPTSIVVGPNNSIAVLEEPTDSIYQINSTGRKLPIVQGLGHILQAVRNDNGGIVAIEAGLSERLREISFGSDNNIWARPSIGDWKRSQLAVDGLGFIYQSEPLLGQINQFNSRGKIINQYTDTIPFLMCGNPQGGVFAFTNAGRFTTVTLLHQGVVQKEVRLDLNPRINACTVGRNGNFYISLINNEFIVLSPEGNKLSTLFEVRANIKIKSMVQDSNSNALWLLNDNQQEILFLDNRNQPVQAANVSENGFLLPDPEGVMFLSESGKRFVVKPLNTAVHDWHMHN